MLQSMGLQRVGGDWGTAHQHQPPGTEASLGAQPDPAPPSDRRSVTTWPSLLDGWILAYAGRCTLRGSHSPEDWGQHCANSDEVPGSWSRWYGSNSGKKF